MKLVKEVNYAYPSSSAAKEFGRPFHGCWVVSVGEDDDLKKDVAGPFDTNQEAVNWAKTLNLPWSSSWLHINKPAA